MEWMIKGQGGELIPNTMGGSENEAFKQLCKRFRFSMEGDYVARLKAAGFVVTRVKVTELGSGGSRSVRGSARQSELVRTVRRLPERVKSLLREAYARPDWEEVTFRVDGQMVVSRWSSKQLRREHLKRLTGMGLLRLAKPGLMGTVEDPAVREAVLAVTVPMPKPLGG